MTTIINKNFKDNLNGIKLVSKLILIQLILLIVHSFKMSNLEIKSGSQSQPVLTKEYYSNGVLKDVGASLDSLKQGYWISYDSLGNLESECIYINDTLNGAFNLYYPTGEPMLIGFMYQGDWNGERTIYYENGNIINKGYWKEGKLDKIWEFYDENGDLDKRIEYENGEEIKIIEDNHLIPAFP